MKLENLPIELLHPICSNVARNDMIAAVRLAGTCNSIRTILEYQSRKVVERAYWTKGRKGKKGFTFIRLTMARVPCPGDHPCSQLYSTNSEVLMSWVNGLRTFHCHSCEHHIKMFTARYRNPGGFLQNPTCPRGHLPLCEACAAAGSECVECARSQLPVLTIPWHNGDYCCFRQAAYVALRHYLRRRATARPHNELSIPGDVSGSPRALFKKASLSRVSLPQNIVVVYLSAVKRKRPPGHERSPLELLKCLDVPRFALRKPDFTGQFYPHQKLHDATARIYLSNDDQERAEKFLRRHGFRFVVFKDELLPPK
jgi:hypothetical protein